MISALSVQAPSAFKVLEEARKDAAVKASQEQLNRARAQLDHCDRILRAQNNEILVLERKRVQQTFPRYAEPIGHVAILGVLAVTVGCGAMISHLPIHPALQMAMVGGTMVGSMWGARKAIVKVMPRLIAGDIRRQYRRERPEYEQKAQQSKQRFDEIYRTTVDRYMHEAEKAEATPQPPAAEVTVDDETVTIGGMKLPRRAD